MEELYQEIILEHNKRPRHFGPLPGATHRADGRNPHCGDELSVSLLREGDRIVEVRFQGQGCAISKASASLMTVALSGLPADRARTLAGRVLHAFQPNGPDLLLEDDGELAALLGVRRFPARVKCATLAWHAFLCALEGGTRISTE